MSMFSSTQPSLRVRVLPRFPANVLAGNGITISKNGGTYVFSVTPPADIPLSALEDMPANSIVGRAGGVGPPAATQVSGGIGFTPGGSLELTDNQRVRGLPFNFFGASLANGVAADLFVPFACTIIGATLLADIAGSVVVDIWKVPFASFPATVANTITGGTPPTLSSAVKYRDTALAGWTAGINAGDCLRINFSGLATITRLYMGLDVRTA